MRADKPDANRSAIVADLRERGFVWVDIGGKVDGAATAYNLNTQSVATLYVEIKNPDRPIVFTASEKKFQAELQERGFHGVYLVATCTEDVLKWFGAL